MHVLAAVLLGAVVSTITIDEQCAQTCIDIVEGYDNLYPKDEVCYNLNTGECNKRSGDTCGRNEVDCLVRANINQGNDPMDLARGFEYLPGRWISHSYLDFLHCVQMDEGECTTDEDCTWKDVEYSTIVNSKHLSSEEDVVKISTNPYVTHPDDALRGAVISTDNDVLRRNGQCVNNNAFIQMRNFQSIGHFGEVKPDEHSNGINAVLYGDNIETLKKGDTISILAGKEVTTGEVTKDPSMGAAAMFASVLWTEETKFNEAPYTDTDYTKVTWKLTTAKVAYSCPSPSFVVHLDVELPKAGNYAGLDDVLACIDGDELQKHGSDTTAGANPFDHTYAYKHNYQAFYNAEKPNFLVGVHVNPLFDTSELSVLIHDKIKKIQVTEQTNLRSIDVRTHTCHPSLREVSIFTKYTKMIHLDDSDFIFAGVFTACVPVTCAYPQMDDSAAEKVKKCTRNLECEVHDVKTYKKTTATGTNILWAAESGTNRICAPKFYKFTDPTTAEYTGSQCEYTYNDFHTEYEGLIGNGGDNSNRFHLAPYPHGSVGVFFNDLEERIAIDPIDMTEGAAVCISFQDVECQSAATGTPARFPCPLNFNGFYQSLTCDKLQKDYGPTCSTWMGTGPLDKWDGDNPPYPTSCTEYCGSTDECKGKGDTLSCDADPANTGPFTCEGKETACGDCTTKASAKFLAPDVPCGHLDPPEDTTTSTTTTKMKTAKHDATCSEDNKCEDCHGTCTDDNVCLGTGATCVLLSATHCDGTATEMVCASGNYLTTIATATTTTTTATATTEVTTTTTNTNTTFVGDCCNVRDHTIIATETGTCDTSQEHIKFTAVGACIEGTWTGHRAWILIPLVGPLIFLLGAWIIEAVVGVDAEGLKKVRASGSAMFLLAVITCVGLQWHAASDDVPGGILAVRIVAIVTAAVSAGILAVLAAWQKDFNFEPILPPLVLANASNEFNAVVRVVFQYMHAATAWLVYGIAARMVYREMDTTKLLTEVVGEDVRAPLMIVAIGLGLQALPLRAFFWSPDKEKEKESLLAVAMRGINWCVLLSFFGASLYSFSSILDSPVDKWKFAAVVATSVVWGFYSFLVPSIAYEQPNYIKGELLLRIVATVLILVGGSMLHEQLDRTHPDKNAVQTFIEADHFLHAAFIAVLVYMIALLILDVALFIFSLCKAERARDKYTGFEKLMQTAQWNW